MLLHRWIKRTYIHTKPNTNINATHKLAKHYFFVPLLFIVSFSHFVHKTHPSFFLLAHTACFTCSPHPFVRYMYAYSSFVLMRCMLANACLCVCVCVYVCVQVLWRKQKLERENEWENAVFVQGKKRHREWSGIEWENELYITHQPRSTKRRHDQTNGKPNRRNATTGISLCSILSYV